MQTRRNPIPKEHQRPRLLSVGGFSDEHNTDLEQEHHSTTSLWYDEWVNNCDGETYENLDLRHIDFRRSSLVGTTFINCDLRECYFQHANLTNTTFRDCDLREAILVYIYSTFINFERSDMRNSTLRVFQTEDGDEIDLSLFNWNRVQLDNAKFESLDFVKYVYALNEGDIIVPNLYIHGFPIYWGLSSTLEGDFSNSKYLKGADLRDASLSRANLQNADLRGADLRGAYIKGANFNNADLRGAIYNPFTIGYTQLTKDQLSVMVLDMH